MPCSSSEEVAGTSQQSLADPSAAGTSGSLPSGTEETDTSSLGAASGSSPGARHRRKASATPSATASAAAEAIAPMRDLASDVAAEVRVPAFDGCQSCIPGRQHLGWFACRVSVRGLLLLACLPACLNRGDVLCLPA